MKLTHKIQRQLFLKADDEFQLWTDPNMNWWVLQTLQRGLYKNIRPNRLTLLYIVIRQLLACWKYPMNFFNSINYICLLNYLETWKVLRLFVSDFLVMWLSGVEEKLHLNYKSMIEQKYWYKITTRKNTQKKKHE